VISRPLAATNCPASPCQGRFVRQHGLTVIELLVSLAVASVLIGLALPAFNNFVAQQTLTAQLNDFIVAVQYARSEAGRRGAFISVHAQNSGDNANEWGPGYCVVVAPPPTAVVCPNDGTELRTLTALGNSKLDGVGGLDGVSTLTFNSRGLLVGTAGTLDLCQAGRTTGRTISISTIGRVSARTKTDCPS
jgi:type IV fimbrial biogenesis protein FimT